VPYGVTNPRQVFNLAAVCALSDTDFAAFVAQTAVATLNHPKYCNSATEVTENRERSKGLIKQVALTKWVGI
jgi:hypothetical protein